MNLSIAVVPFGHEDKAKPCKVLAVEFFVMHIG